MHQDRGHRAAGASSPCVASQPPDGAWRCRNQIARAWVEATGWVHPRRGGSDSQDVWLQTVRALVGNTGDTDRAFVGFQEFRLGEHQAEFLVNLAAVFGPLLEWFEHQQGSSARLTGADGLWRTRLLVPGKDWADDPHLWELDLADEERVQRFQQTLVAALEKLE